MLGAPIYDYLFTNGGYMQPAIGDLDGAAGDEVVAATRSVSVLAARGLLGSCVFRVFCSGFAERVELTIARNGSAGAPELSFTLPSAGPANSRFVEGVEDTGAGPR